MTAEKLGRKGSMKDRFVPYVYENLLPDVITLLLVRRHRFRNRRVSVGVSKQGHLSVNTRRLLPGKRILVGRMDFSPEAASAILSTLLSAPGQWAERNEATEQEANNHE